jgi:two-component system, NtrC family, sensor kinase
MRKVFSILLLFFSVAAHTQIASTQALTIDSLKGVLSHYKEDTTKVDGYSNLSFTYLYVNGDSAIAYANAGLDLSRKLDYIKGEAILLVIKGEAFANQKQNFAKGLELKLEALQKVEPLGDSDLLAFCYLFTGANYIYSEDFEAALTYYNKAKVYSGVQYSENKYLLGPMGSCYLHLNKLDSAYYYTKLAYDLDQKEDSHWEILYQTMGEIEQERGNYREALRFFRIQQALVGEPSIVIAATFNKIGQRDSALYYAKQILVGAGFASIRLRASSLLTDIYASDQALDSAFKYQQITLALKDTIYNQEKAKQVKNIEFNERERQLQGEQQRKQAQQQYEVRIRTYSLLAGLAVLTFVAVVLYRNNRQKQRTYAVLQQKNQQIEHTLQELKATQAQLIQSEKMASLGELTAGIAHEIQNPLNFVNNFSDINKELLGELRQEVRAGKTEDALQLAENLEDNTEKISYHGRRAEAIVKSMLEHSRSSKGERQPTNLNALIDEYLRLAYHGFRAKDKSFNTTLQTNFDETIGMINIVPQEIGRVLLNLFNNAFYATHEQMKKLGEGGYEPIVTVSTKRLGDKVEIQIKDNGMGISKNLVDKIFQPFFTTKPTGEGTGLGLSLSYDIVKAHGGELKVESTEGQGAAFIILLPMT